MSQMISALGTLLCFAGPSRPYPVANAEALMVSAWTKAGNALTSAMSAHDGKSKQFSESVPKQQQPDERAKA